ncbi:MAG TPA: ABC transporter permease [Saprospiraceae bacterium]|nr:ABC transporter permease [Saprospiraceae bacterium]
MQLGEVWNYRDLLLMFVKRDFVAGFKQTILGPLWFFIQPVFTTLMFTLVFGKIAGISTDGQPKMLFYLSGLTIWNYFADTFNKTSTVFITNAAVFGKVYFPRLIAPLSIIVAGLLRFAVQMILFIGFYAYYMITLPGSLHPTWALFLVPFLILLMAGFALGFGIIISALTTKYRDMIQLIAFGVTLLMYATPVIYPMNSIPGKYQVYIALNPLSPIVETFRYAFLGSGMISWSSLTYSFVFMLVAVITGTLIFNKVERTFMDTV